MDCGLVYSKDVKTMGLENILASMKETVVSGLAKRAIPLTEK